jgi:hypothetical protein
VSIPQQDFGSTSNDLLESRIAKRNSAAANCQIVAKSAEDVPGNENAPAVSMATALAPVLEE